MILNSQIPKPWEIQNLYKDNPQRMPSQIWSQRGAATKKRNPPDPMFFMSQHSGPDKQGNFKVGNDSKLGTRNLEYEEKKGPSEITLDKHTLYTVSTTTKSFFSTLYPKPSPITSLGKKD
jgi:hypothetical protein